MNRRNFSSSSSSGASSSSNFNRGERQRPKAPSSLPPLTARTVRQVADGMLDAAKRFERLFQKLPQDKVRIDFRPTFLVYRRDDDVVAGCPAAFYHLGHLLRIAGDETGKETWPRILAVRYPGSGGDAAAAAETLAVGPDNRKYPLSGYAHGFDAAREDLPAVADSVQPHNRHVVNWHAGAMRLAKSLHLHDINVLTNWLNEHDDVWGADPEGLFIDARSWLGEKAGDPNARVPPEALAERLRGAAERLQALKLDPRPNPNLKNLKS